MEKLGEIMHVKILISGKTQSYNIDVNRLIKLTELSILICQKFYFKIDDIKIILNNKPIEKYKDQCLTTAIPKDKKPYVIIYFVEKESKLILIDFKYLLIIGNESKIHSQLMDIKKSMNKSRDFSNRSFSKDKNSTNSIF